MQKPRAGISLTTEKHDWFAPRSQVMPSRGSSFPSTTSLASPSSLPPTSVSSNTVSSLSSVQPSVPTLQRDGILGARGEN